MRSIIFLMLAFTLISCTSDWGARNGVPSSPHFGPSPTSGVIPTENPSQLGSPIVISSTSVCFGDEVRITGGRFKPNSEFPITLAKKQPDIPGVYVPTTPSRIPSEIVLLGKARTDASGGINFVFNISEIMEPTMDNGKMRLERNTTYVLSVTQEGVGGREGDFHICKTN